MKRNLRMAAGIGFAATALAATAVFPAWKALIYDFQTLITGLAAVTAAVLTIRTMEETDKSAQDRHEQLVANARTADAVAQRRHEQLVETSLRRDRLIIERMLYPRMIRLLTERETLAAAFFPIPEFERSDDESLQPILVDGVPDAEVRLVAIRDLIKKEDLDDDLLDGPSAFYLSELRSRVQRGLNAVNRVREMIVEPLRGQKPPDVRLMHKIAVERRQPEDVRAVLNRYNDALTEIIDRLDIVLPALKLLAAEYGLSEIGTRNRPLQHSL